MLTTIENDYSRVKRILGKDRLSREDYTEHSNISYYQLIKGFGTWTNFKLAIGEKPLYSSAINKKVITKVARALYDEHGKLTSQLMIDNGYPQTEIDRNFGSFTQMMKEIGLRQEEVARGHNRKEEDFMDNLMLLEHEFGYANASLNDDNNTINSKSYIYKYGSYSEACLKAGVRHIGNSTILNPAGQAITAIREVAGILQEEDYHTEVAFNWLRNPRTNTLMPVDAYFPERNLIVEYHGPQHYIENHFFNKNRSHTSFEESKERDRLKKKIVLENNMDYVSIFDYEKDNIEWILNNRISSKRL